MGAPAPFNPAPTTPTPEGMAQWDRIAKRVAKRKAAQAKKSPPKSTPSNPAGTAGPNDPVWKSLADLYSKGLPG